MRIRALDWPLAAIAFASTAALGFRDGGYFPTEWGWSSLGLLWIAAIALFVRERLPVGRLELAVLAAFAGFVGWVALSSAWSTSLERSILEVQRDLSISAGFWSSSSSRAAERSSSCSLRSGAPRCSSRPLRS
jgi:hypothetical protein